MASENYIRSCFKKFLCNFFLIIIGCPLIFFAPVNAHNNFVHTETFCRSDIVTHTGCINKVYAPFLASGRINAVSAVCVGKNCNSNIFYIYNKNLIAFHFGSESACLIKFKFVNFIYGFYKSVKTSVKAMIICGCQNVKARKLQSICIRIRSVESRVSRIFASCHDRFKICKCKINIFNKRFD